MVNYKIHITVHAYAEGNLDDHVLVSHSKNYGIHGKEIVAPLRKINGCDCVLNNVSEQLSVRELWNWIFNKIYGKELCSERIRTTLQYHVIKKYLVFNGIRYTIDDAEEPLQFFLQRMNMSESAIIHVQLLLHSDAGEVYKNNGIKYYIWSKEYGSHNCPHLHVDIQHKWSGSFSLIDGTQLSGDVIPQKYLNEIKNTIMEMRPELLVYWNEHTDGLRADLNQVLGTIDY